MAWFIGIAAALLVAWIIVSSRPPKGPPRDGGPYT